ncbi:O-antigen ligase [Collimonas arenae]|uniref:O-antigen ligase n=1 Tax=Collimonas arenae TaxID=279058 RepID=A0A0A1F5U1_9BURK|nr:O-antigen ligase family protein [Collimonas arenae]AIY40078.1 O-antigen ligase [Collimonas arenae]
MRYSKLLVTALLIAFYILALVVDRSAGVIFGLLLLFGLVFLVSGKKANDKSFVQLVKEYWPLHLTMCAWLIAVLANQIGSGHFLWRTYDPPFRLAMFVLVFWVMSFLSIRYMKYVQWAWVIGAFLSAVKIHVLTGGGAMRYGSDFIPIIIFGELTLLLGIFSALSIVWNKPENKIAIFFKIAALCAGLYAAYLSQSRGVWLTIFVFIAIALLVTKNIRSSYKLSVVISFVVFLGAISYFGNIVKERVLIGESDITQYSAGKNIDTSLGTRLQLWHGSWVLFTEHPLTGVGVEGFPLALEELSKRNIITPLSATFPHSHNEILFMMSKLGLFGLFTILALYCTPAYYFFRNIRNNDSEIRYIAAMGLALCLGFFTLGLVDVVFLWWEVYPYYTISIAFFLIYIMKRKEFLDKPKESHQ